MRSLNVYTVSIIVSPCQCTFGTYIFTRREGPTACEFQIRSAELVCRAPMQMRMVLRSHMLHVLNKLISGIAVTVNMTQAESLIDRLLGVNEASNWCVLH